MVDIRTSTLHPLVLKNMIFFKTKLVSSEGISLIAVSNTRANRCAVACLCAGFMKSPTPSLSATRQVYVFGLFCTNPAEYSASGTFEAATVSNPHVVGKGGLGPPGIASSFCSRLSHPIVKIVPGEGIAMVTVGGIVVAERVQERQAQTL